MKLSELIDKLSDVMSEYGDCDVRMATPPTYPLQHLIAGLAVKTTESEREELNTALEESEDEEEKEEIRKEISELEAVDSTLYILEGSSPRDNPYASSRLWEETV